MYAASPRKQLLHELFGHAMQAAQEETLNISRASRSTKKRRSLDPNAAFFWLNPGFSA
jgi:hypothetical protein